MDHHKVKVLSRHNRIMSVCDYDFAEVLNSQYTFVSKATSHFTEYIIMYLIRNFAVYIRCLGGLSISLLLQATNKYCVPTKFFEIRAHLILWNKDMKYTKLKICVITLICEDWARLHALSLLVKFIQWFT